MEYCISLCSSFPKIPTGGNKAGVCIVDTIPTEDTMQHIATEMALSETAFVELRSDNHVHVRFFTPTQEVPLCGHATVAVFAVLYQKHGYTPGMYRMSGILGERRVEILEGGYVRLEQNPLELGEKLNNLDSMKFSDVEEDDVWEEFPARVISVGLPIAVLGIRSCGTLVSMEVDAEAVEDYLAKHQADILYILSKQVVHPESSVQARMFAPKLGIMDEPATGMAAGAAGAYLYQQGLEKESVIRIEQGYSTGQPSEIVVQISGTPEEIAGVAIVGTAVIKEERSVHRV